MADDQLDGPVRVSSKPNGVILVELNRPDRFNALNDEMVSGLLRDVFAAITTNKEARVLVLTGSGQAFSAGGDLNAAAFDADEDKTEFIRSAQTTVTTLLDIPIPTIAAVNGPAAGGGMALALACDIRIAGRNAFYSCPFLSMGLIPDFGASFLLSRTIGSSNALFMALTGRRVHADESLRLGLSQEISDDPLERALELAGVIALGPPLATIATKKALLSAGKVEADRQILEIEPVLQAEMMAGSEFRERFEIYRTKVLERPQN